MTVFVDSLQRRGTWRLGPSCHMLPESLSAGSLAELHAMADAIGMRREWFQDRSRWPHYDLTATRRGRAVNAGCVEIRTSEWIRRQRQALAVVQQS